MKLNQLQTLFEEMTLDEKIGQTVQITGNFFDDADSAITGPMEEMNLGKADLKRVGSILGGTGAADIKRIQSEYLKHNRLGIPLLFMADVIHGYRTIFPIPLGLASSFNPRLVEKTAEVAARESATAGVHVTFSPMVDLVRDARWGRVLETNGEDPYLNEKLAKALVRGYQGKDLASDVERLAACVKHFAGYGAPNGGLDYNTVDISEHVLRDQYLTGYQAAISEGAKMVMASFNTINGIPATGNKWLLDEVLRKEMNFEGVIISDWAAINELMAHGVAKDQKEAAAQALKAGIDIDMMSGAYLNHLKDIVEEDKAMAQLLDKAVWRILLLKNELGLFENPFRGADESKEQLEMFNTANRAVAQKAAEESIVLLKNKQLLPLQENKKIALVGPKKESRDLLGSWSLNGRAEETRSLAEALEEEYSSGQVRIVAEKDVFNGLYSYQAADLYEADAIVVALGEESFMSGEAASRSNISLPVNQLVLLKELQKLEKPIVVILFNGRPLDLTEVNLMADAIVEAWFPGSEGAKALARILTGKVNPSGKLAMSFPRHVGQLPLYYNRHSTGRPFTRDKQDEKYLSRYLDIDNSPLYPFGFGLSYSSFSYGPLQVNKKTFNRRDELVIRVELTNKSVTRGTEIVQLYVRDNVAQVVRPVKELKGFKRVTLNPSETTEVTFSLNERDFEYLHPDGSWSSDSGDFEIMVGPNSEETEKITVYLTNGN